MEILLGILKRPISIESTNWMTFFNDQCYDWIVFSQHKTSELTTNRRRINSGYIVSDSRLKDPRKGEFFYVHMQLPMYVIPHCAVLILL